MPKAFLKAIKEALFVGVQAWNVLDLQSLDDLHFHFSRFSDIQILSEHERERESWNEMENIPIITSEVHLSAVCIYSICISLCRWDYPHSPASN